MTTRFSMAIIDQFLQVLVRIRSATSVALVALLVSAGAHAQTTTEYIHTDALGSPVAVTDASGNLIEREVYEPYGSPITRPPSDQPGFTGHVADSLTNLTYMQQRYYDPQIGRFLSVDPVTAYSNPVGAFNRYAYAANNPYRFTDPDGRQFCESRVDCEMVRDDMAVANGTMTRQEQSDRINARGAGALIGLGTVATGYAGVRLIPAIPVVGRYLAAREARRESTRQVKAQAERGIRSLEKRIAEHVKKAEDFKSNPTVRPGMERMSEEAIKAQQAVRLQHLEDEIQTFKNNIEKLKELL